MSHDFGLDLLLRNFVTKSILMTRSLGFVQNQHVNYNYIHLVLIQLRLPIYSKPNICRSANGKLRYSDKFGDQNWSVQRFSNAMVLVVDQLEPEVHFTVQCQHLPYQNHCWMFVEILRIRWLILVAYNNIHWAPLPPNQLLPCFEVLESYKFSNCWK